MAVVATISQIKGLIRKYPDDVSVLILGQPGCGKTDLSIQLAEEMAANYLVFLTSTMDPTDVVGVPHPQELERYNVTDFYPPKRLMLLTVEAEYTGPMVACFDDLPAADERVFAALFRLFQHREIADHKIRDNVLLIGTGNRVEDKAAARQLPTALNNRFAHFNLQINMDEWKGWAIQHHVQPQIVGFIQALPQHLNNFNPNSPEPAFATPRSIVMASRIQEKIGVGHPDHFIAIAGAVGESWAVEYDAFLKNCDLLIPPDEIFKNAKDARMPDRQEIDVLHATTSALTYAIAQKPTVNKCKSALIYAQRIPQQEMGMVLARDIVQNIIVKAEDMQFRADVCGCEEFLKMHKEYGKYLTG